MQAVGNRTSVPGQYDDAEIEEEKKGPEVLPEDSESDVNEQESDSSVFDMNQEIQSTKSAPKVVLSDDIKKAVADLTDNFNKTFK